MRVIQISVGTVKGSDEVWDDDGMEVEKNLLLEKFSQRGRQLPSLDMAGSLAGSPKTRSSSPSRRFERRRQVFGG